jgi:NCS1 family nucleobase:cation symporter-1
MLSPETKKKIAYWGAKLECPVDDNANYENTYVSVSFQYLVLHS